MKSLILAALFCSSCMAAPVQMLCFVYDAKMIPMVDSLAKNGPVIAIVNPDNGPGVKLDLAYTNAISSWRKNRNVSIKPYVDLAKWKGGKLVGYKKPREIRDELEAYNRIYAFVERDGAWYDDAQLDSDDVKALFSVLPLNGNIIANPGESAKGTWMAKLPIRICEFEDPWNGPPKCGDNSIWIVFIKQNDIQSVLNAARGNKVFALGVEDLSRRNKGEYQSPPPWIQKLITLNK